MEDITPSLLKSIQEDFQKGFDKSSTISRLYAKVRDGTVTYEEANDFAIEVGEILAGAYKKNLSSSVLPDGRMYYNIANRIITPTITNNYNLIVAVTKQVQEVLNKSAGIGIKAIIPNQNTDRIKGIVDKVSDAENYDDVAWVLGEPIINHAQSIVADSIKANAEFQYEAGLNPKIVRKSTGKCCEWCNTVVGVYEYPNVPKDVYRRHDHCRCSVNYIAGKKKVDVHHGNTGKRRYVKDEYGSYVLSKDARIERAKQMAATEKERKKIARQKRIDTWKKKKTLNTMLDNAEKSSTIKLDDILIHKSVGAKVKNYDVVDPSSGEIFNFAEGTRIQNAEVFAGKGTRIPLHDGVAEGLAEQIGGKAEKWQHCKGNAILDYYGEERLAEIHWFQEETVGKVKFKVKRWKDES